MPLGGGGEMASRIPGWNEDATAWGYMEFIKLALIGAFIIIILSIKGVRAAMVMTALLIPLFLLSIIVGKNKELQDIWETSTKKENFSRLPLKEDVHSIRNARKGSKVKQALIEERLRDEIFYTLKNKNELTEEEIKEIKNDPKKVDEFIENDTFRRYLLNMKSLADFKTIQKGKKGDPFTKKIQRIGSNNDIDFEEKVKETMNELEKINKWTNNPDDNS